MIRDRFDGRKVDKAKGDLHDAVGEQTIENQLRELRQIAERRSWEVVQRSSTGFIAWRSRQLSRRMRLRGGICKQRRLTLADYTLVSVAVDLNIAQLVDVPNLGVTAILNRDIFKP